MLYIDLDDHSIEVIQTGKNILGGENIIACSHKEIPEGIIINGLVVDPKNLSSILKDIFISAYPKVIKDQQVTLSVSDKQVFTHHFHFNEDNRNLNLSEKIINEAKNILPYDPSELVNFYKVLGTTSSETDVIYTACAKNTVTHFAKSIQSVGLSLIYLYPRSSSIFEWLKHLLEDNENIIYSSVNKKNSDYLVFNKFGLVTAIYKKLGSKSYAAETKTVINEVEKEKSIKINRLILAGINAMELHTSEVTDSINIPVVKLSEVIDNILINFKIKFDSGGISKMLFIHSLSSLILKKSESPPNFASDLGKIHDLLPEKNVNKDKLPVASFENREFDKVSDIDFGLSQSGDLQQPVFSKIKSNKKVLIGFLSIATLIIVFLGIFFFLGRNGQIGLSIIPKPTITLVPSVVPTITSIPTIDPNIKRTDIKISVQNGTQKTGYAKDIVLKLESLGYKNIAKSNADRDDYEKTVIKIKDAKKAYIPLLSSDLKDQIDMTTIEALETSNPFDLIIILGSK